jgi:CBS domain-containing protein
VAGPAVNVVIAAGLAVALLAAGSDRLVARGLSPDAAGVLPRLLLINIFIVLFNLLPAFPMDGGRVLRSLLALRFSFDRATRIAARTGQGMALLFGLAGLFGNPMLLIIAFFVWFGAAQEAAASRIQATLSNLPVTSAMLTRFEVLHPDDPLARAADLILSGSQADFPVVENGRVVGVLSRSSLLAGLQDSGEQAPVRSRMNVHFIEIRPRWPPTSSSRSRRPPSTRSSL